MNKNTLVSKMAENTGLTKAQSEAALKAFIDIVEDTLKEGDSIQLVGFGTFAVKERPARTARNPRTGEPMEVAAKKIPTFKPGKSFKDMF
ncbi:MAG: HU family DNA-binding protein [Clostridiales bacterium]|nr:HU family DNA-binding protein [Clostridiales bacterium]